MNKVEATQVALGNFRAATHVMEAYPTTEHKQAVWDTADIYARAEGDARELKGHTDICIEVMMVDGKSWLCGSEKGYCPKAPKED